MRSRFDWQGFVFVVQLVALAGIGGGAAHIGWAFAEAQYDVPETPVLATPITASSSLAALVFSTSTPQRVINALSIHDVVPAEGKFIAADLQSMTITLYENGVATSTLPIKKKGKPGTPWETPSGFYSIQTKEESHFSTIGKVYMPYSMQFYGNYFIHGWTYYPDGTPTPETFSGGCIKLSTENAEKVFAFADVGTKLFVYDPPTVDAISPLALAPIPQPRISARSYLVADIDTGDVYAEREADIVRPIASVTKLMTALVANETISFDKKITVAEGALTNPRNLANTRLRQFVVGDLLYPLLMQSSNHVADALAEYYGTKTFVQWMNTGARALEMASTTYADASGLSSGNVSTAEDLYRLARYIENKKSFIFGLTREPDRFIAAQDGSRYSVKNVNAPANTAPFEGGKIGYTDEAKDTMVSIVSIQQSGEKRRVAIIVLGSDDQTQDTSKLARWLSTAVSKADQSACASCALSTYRKIAY
ncbi:MAG: hypothetical protein RLZZ342_726 [Candidatus Parcubacteria bacterium]